MTVFVYNSVILEYVFIFFRSQANGNCLFSSFLVAMCGDNRYVNDFRIVTANDLHWNSVFLQRASMFHLIISKYPKVFCSIDTTLAISVSF